MESATTPPASLNQSQDGTTIKQPKVVECDGTTATAAPTAADKPPKTTVKYDDYDGYHNPNDDGDCYLTPNDDGEDDDGDDCDANHVSEDDDSDANNYDDFYNTLERDLRIAISADDVAEFVAQVKLLFNLDDFDGNLKLGETAEPNTRELILCPDHIKEEICCSGAVACATALLEGQTCLFMDLNVPIYNVQYPLDIATFALNYDLVKLFLSHGAQVDVFDILSPIKRCPLPLNTAFARLSNHLYLVDWTPEESIYKLLIILCLPQMKVALETVRLLALRTKYANEVFIGCAKEGKLIEMAVLLLVANERIMTPGTFQSNDGGVVEGGTSTICDTIIKYTLSQVDEECEKSKLIFTLMLLKLFERTGGAIRSYLQSRQSHVSKERVVTDVASILKEAGFVLKEKDIDLSDIDCESDWIKEATGTSENSAVYNSAKYLYMVFPPMKAFFLQRQKQVVKDVTSALRDAGFLLMDKDIGLTNTYSKSDETKESTRSSAENIPRDEPEMYRDTLPSFNSVSNAMLSPLGRPVGPVNPHGSPSSFDLLASQHVRNFSSCPFFMRQKNQFKGEKNAMWRRVQPSNSSKVLASLAMAFKRGLRRV